MSAYYGFANDAGKLQSLKVDLIDEDPDQPRKFIDPGELESLAASMGEIDLLQPIVVYRAGKRYTLLVGARRLRAARMLGWTTIDARVVETPEHITAIQLAENFQRQSMQPWETMLAFERLVDYTNDLAGMCRITGVSRRQVNRYLAVAQHPQARALLLGGASLRDACALLPDDDAVPAPAAAGGAKSTPLPVQRKQKRAKPAPAPGDGRVAKPAHSVGAEAVGLARELAARWPQLTGKERTAVRGVLRPVMDD